jgi:Ca2+-binding RTX toxin-like protein
MVDSVLRMTASQFVMRLALTETTSVDVTINGMGLKYDPASGMILSGEIGSLSLTNYAGTATKQSLVNIQQINNLDIASLTLVEAMGDKFWNNAKLVVDQFDKLASLNPSGSVSYFSPTKSYANGTDNDDAITGSKYNEEMHGRAGDDVLYGGSGIDRMYGEQGDDALYGDSGNDLLVDADGNNQLFGGNNNDILRGGAGVDRLDGGNDSDIIYGGGGYDWASGGTGIDKFVFSVKDAGKLTVMDFSDADVLVNLALGSREEAYKDFIEHARQSNRNVVYDNGDTHVVLKAYKLDHLHLENFGDATSVPDMNQWF